MAVRPIDLAALNPAERAVLRLLARGHTAKSIAAAERVTVGAVNERLREARRKTGVGSSRELARLLAAQENRDEKIGVAAAAAPGESFAGHGAPGAARRSSSKGTIVMLLAALGIAAAIAVQTVGQSPDPARDPEIGGFFRQSSNLGPGLYARVRSERRDAAWADRTEAALRSAYAGIAGVDPASLRVRCAATVCEVAGGIATSADAPAAVAAVQGKSLLNALSRLGLTSRSTAFRASADKPTQFLAYWTRDAVH
jgi:DNA-binding CsgD family transcriptional regulator